MPVLTQLNLNVGTELNPNMVLHDLHDIRISSTDVNIVTRLLGCDAGVNSIAPLTLASAASLLGEKFNVYITELECQANVDTQLDLINGFFFVTIKTSGSVAALFAKTYNGITLIGQDGAYTDWFSVSNINHKVTITSIVNITYNVLYYKSA